MDYDKDSIAVQVVNINAIEIEFDLFYKNFCEREDKLCKAFQQVWSFAALWMAIIYYAYRYVIMFDFNII